jgi:tetratricopeptide (TPR) repeat protein
VAGLLDLLAQGALCLLLFLLALRFGGVAMPVVTVLAVVLGYSAVPLWLFGATPAMRLLGVRLVRLEGRPLELMDVIARELVWSGILPAAYFLTIIAGAVARLLGQPWVEHLTGSPGWLGLASLLFILLALLGHLVMLVRPDHRGLADLMTRTLVVPRQPAPEPVDEDERLEARQHHRRRVRNLVLFQASLLAVNFALPYAFNRPVAGNEAYVARLKLQQSERRFRANSEDPEAAAQYLDMLREAGELEEAKQVEAQYRAALRAREAPREAALRERLAQEPADLLSFDALTLLLEDQGRAEEARALFQRFLRAERSAEQRALYGQWLSQHGFHAEAVEQLERTHRDGIKSGETYAALGVSLRALGRYPQARAALQRAIELDPELSEYASEELEALDTEEGASRDSPAAP